MKNNFLLMVFVFGLILIAGCVHKEQVVPRDSVSGNKDTEVAREDTGETKEFDLIAKQWAFEPSTIEVNKGDTVKLNIKSIDVRHGFKLPDFRINEALEPGKIVNIEFVADKTGTFTFSCSVFCGSGHKDMTGQLIVK